MKRFDCDRCGVNVAYHTAACIAAQISERDRALNSVRLARERLS